MTRERRAGSRTEPGRPGEPTGAFAFDDRAIAFTPGQTVAGALIAAGIRSWRTTRLGGRPRGLFCGIGICFDCLVRIDGRSNRRACLELAVDGMRVTTQVGTGHDDLAV